MKGGPVDKLIALTRQLKLRGWEIVEEYAVREPGFAYCFELSHPDVSGNISLQFDKAPVSRDDDGGDKAQALLYTSCSLDRYPDIKPLRFMISFDQYQVDVVAFVETLDKRARTDTGV